MRHELKWTVGFSDNAGDRPKKQIPAVVPGAVQLDWARAEGWPSYTYGDNYEDYGWMEDVYWSYIALLDLPELPSGHRAYFVCRGVDYKFDVRVDGALVHAQEGMFTPFELDLTEMDAQGKELEISVYPAPKREGAWVGRSQADQCCKPAVSYGWDWHPRLIPLGIWDDTFIEIRPTSHLANAEPLYALSQDLTHVDVSLNVALSAPLSGKVLWKLFDPAGRCAGVSERPAGSEAFALTMSLDNPELWWPNGEGEPALYRSQVELLDESGTVVDVSESQIGFRRIQLVMHPGAWREPEGFPKTRSNPPITLEVNGKQIFCKGTNWVNPEIFPGTITEETYRPLLDLAKGAHFNILRSWGGGIINKEAFFDICDEYGLMVWQEFPLSCNDYKGTPEYLAILDQESKSIITRLRSHACLAMWCGGNELFNGWSRMTEQSPALRLLNRNCYDLDRDTPFMMTSPLMGMAHGHYSFKYDSKTEVFQAMPQASNTAYTEFGCPGPSAADYLKTFIPEDDLFPPRTGTAWETHHAFKAWIPTSHLMPEVIEEYFGPPQTLEELVSGGQTLQSEGYKCIYEEARRQKPRCSMALNWCFNEPWPSAANNSLVNWPAVPKPCYSAVKASCRPVLSSARIPKFAWTEGELFNPELWLLNDSPTSVPPGRMEASLLIGEEKIPLLSWDFPGLKPNTNCPGPVLRFALPHGEAERMTLVLRVEGRPELNSEYMLVYRARLEHGQRHGARTLNA